MTIHSTHPFATPGPSRDAARQFRGRLPSPVTLWLTGSAEARAGITVSSIMVALGQPATVVGLLDPDSSFMDALGDTFTVTILGWEDRALADAFGGVAPAPGGPFRLGPWLQTAWGPVPSASRTWLGARVRAQRPLGWSTEVVADIEHVELDDHDPVSHVRGAYRRLQQPGVS